MDDQQTPIRQQWLRDLQRKKRKSDTKAWIAKVAVVMCVIGLTVKFITLSEVPKKTHVCPAIYKVTT